jgi:asparagine synthase (glutamine-hydrolysing)
MPGLAGFIGDFEQGASILIQMQKFLHHKDFYKDDECLYDGLVGCTRSHTNIIQKESQPYIYNDVFIWLDGEFYNQDELLDNFASSKTDPEVLLELYTAHDPLDFLKKIDGIFSAVIYDKKKQQVFLVTDRYGLRHLYWSNTNGVLSWSSEVKAFLACPWIIPTVNTDSVHDFFSIGYLLEDRTWFNEVELLPSGSVLRYDLRTQSTTQKRYWWWDEIKPLQGRIDERELAEELGRLFIESVKKRCRSGEKVGLTLSGGLDSRAILAAMPDTGHPIHAVTFGKTGCDDVRIASQVARMKGAVHHVETIDDQNWILPRIEGVWWTDGQFDLLHMHGIESLLSQSQRMNISLNGFLGDAILGGSYFNDARWSTIQKFENRGKKFIVFGPITISKIMNCRIPFFDNALMELTVSIPESLRQNSYIYNKMLLMSFNNYYKDIPWQNTGLPINSSPQKVKIHSFFNRVKGKLGRMTGLSSGTKSYSNYPDWIRTNPGKNIFTSFLNDKNALYAEFIDPKKVESDLQLHMNGANKSDNLCRYLTFELWLQQVYNKKFRHGLES